MKIALCDDISQFPDKGLEEGYQARLFLSSDLVTASFDVESTIFVRVPLADFAMKCSARAMSSDTE